MSLLSLPTEIQLLTLLHLSFRDVIHCRALCKHFCALVDSSKELAFIIELGAAGARNNASSQDPMLKKVEKLWRSNIAWANLHWLYRRKIPLSGTGQHFDISDGLFFYATPENDLSARNATTIEWVRLPSRCEPNPSYQPERVTFDVPLSELAVDSTQDLIIGVELTSFRASRYYTIMCNLHLKSISTNVIHPLAARHVLSTRFGSPVTDFVPNAQICGNHIGILISRKFGVSNPDSFDMFLLVDWTTGVFKASMGTYHMEEFWESFCFLTPDSVLIPSAVNSLLNIYYFDNTPDSLRHEVSLLLPEPLTRRGLRHAYLRSRPSPSATYHSHPTGENPPFVSDPDEAIVILSLVYQYHLRQGHCNLPQVVAIPRRVLTQSAHLARERNPRLISLIDGFHGRSIQAGLCSSSSSASVPVGKPAIPCCEHEEVYMHVCNDSRNKRFPHLHSEQWILHTRWALDSTSPSMGGFAYGSRYLGMTSRISLPNTSMSSIALYDFNVRNERRGYGYMLEEENVRPYPEPDDDDDDEFNEDEDEDWDYDEETGEKRWPVYASRLVTTPTTVDVPEIFKMPFTTALPYRVTETEMVLSWDSAVIDGERIIGLEFVDYDTGSIDNLDVIVI